MNMLWRTPSLTIIGCLVVVAVVLLFPIWHPSLTVEENPKTGIPFEVSREQKLVQPLPAPVDNVSGVVFWVRPPSEGQLASEIVVTLVREGTAEPVYVRHALLSDVYDRQAGSVRFIFWPHYFSAGEQLLIVLEMPTIEAARPFVLRPAIAESEAYKAALQLLTTQPLAVAFVRSVYSYPTEGQDINYYWRRGASIAHGENPYACVVDNSCIDRKNPGHFPLFYWLSAVAQKAGLADYGHWIAFWRPVFLLCYVGIAVIVFTALYREGQVLLALFGAFFWLFNRWSLYVAGVGQIDFIALFFLMLSIALLRRRYWLAVFLFSVSLAFKQVAIFLGPLYLIYAWQRAPQQRVKTVLLTFALSALVPLLALVPFVIDNASAVTEGLLFSLTRNPTTENVAASLDAFLRISGPIGALPMLALMGLIYMAAGRRKIPFALSALLIFLTFIGFNHVLFNQYFIWALPFVPLAIAEALRGPQTAGVVIKEA